MESKKLGTHLCVFSFQSKHHLNDKNFSTTLFIQRRFVNSPIF